MTQINRQTASGSPNYFGNQPDKICWDDLRAHSLEKWGHRRGFLIFSRRSLRETSLRIFGSSINGKMRRCATVCKWITFLHLAATADPPPQRRDEEIQRREVKPMTQFLSLSNLHGNSKKVIIVQTPNNWSLLVYLLAGLRCVRELRRENIVKFGMLPRTSRSMPR